MGGIIEAKAVISAEDRATAVIRKIGQEIARISQSVGKASAAMGAGRTVDAAGAAMKRAEAMTRGYTRATAKAAKATTALHQVRAGSAPGPGKMTLSDSLRQDTAALRLTRRETSRLGRDIVRTAAPAPPSARRW